MRAWPPTRRLLAVVLGVACFVSTTHAMSFGPDFHVRISPAHATIERRHVALVLACSGMEACRSSIELYRPVEDTWVRVGHRSFRAQPGQQVDVRVPVSASLAAAARKRTISVVALVRSACRTCAALLDPTDPTFTQGRRTVTVRTHPARKG